MRVLGVDGSSKKIAMVIINDGQVETYMEIFLTEVTPHKRLTQCRKLLEDCLPLLGNIDYIGFEKAVQVRSAKTSIVLASYFGVMVSVLSDLNAKLIELEPLVWQSYIGNKNLTAAERRELKSQHPELKNKTQEATFFRKYRKERTLGYSEKRYGFRFENDDLGDACGIASYVYDNVEAILNRDKI